MTRGYTNQRDTWVNTEPYDAVYMNSLVRILDSQVHGALEGVGAGIIDGGDVAAGTGLSVTVAALKAIVSTEHLLTYLQTDAPVTVADLEPSSTLYIHAAAVFATSPGDPDSREDAGVVLFASDSDVEPNAILLATVVTGSESVTSVTDAREYVPAQEALTALQALSTSVSDLEDALDALTARVDAIEAGGGGGGAVGYWGALERTASDPTRINQFVDEEIADHVDAYHSGEETGGGTALQIEQWETDAANFGQSVLAITRKLDQNHPDEFRDAVTIVHGVYGDGSGSSPDWVDHVNTTWS